MAGLSERAKLFLEISNSFTEHDTTRLRETLVAEYHFDRAMVENKLPHEIFNMLEELEDNKMAPAVDVLMKLGKEKFAKEIENVQRHDQESGSPRGPRPFTGQLKRKGGWGRDGEEIPVKKSAPCREEGLPVEVGVRKYFFYIKEKVSPDWEDLAFHLGFGRPEINNIADRNKDNNSRCMDLLEEWLKRNGERATIEVLMEALSKANLQSVVDGLKNEFAGSSLSAGGPSSPSWKASFDQTSQQTDQTLLQRVTEMAEEIKQLQKKIETLEQRNYIKRCESGVIELPGSSIMNGYGARTDYRSMPFSMPFDKKPVVTIGLTKVDHPGSDVRVKVEVVDVSTTGLTVCFTTWNHSKLHSAIVNWMACA